MFIDVSKDGDIDVRFYEDSAEHIAMLLSFGKSGPRLKIAPEQVRDLHSALLREFECAVQ